MARRYDTIQLSDKAYIDKDGYLYDTPVLTLAEKVFIYRNADGSVRREYRPRTEVFSSQSLASYKGRPLTVRHPPEDVTADNVSQYSVGTILSEGRAEGNQLVADIVVHQPDKMGGRRELSVGYDTDLVLKSGKTDSGDEYDAIQTNIRANHAAIVERGRAGRTARLNLDGDEEIPGTQNEEELKNMKKVTIRGIEYDAAPEVAAELAAKEKEIAELKEQVTKTEAERDTAQTKLDTAEKETEKTRKDAEENLSQAVKARLDVMYAAEKYGVKNADSLSDMEIKKAVIKSVHGDSFDLEGKNSDYINACFDLAKKDRTDKAIAEQRKAAFARKDNADSTDDISPAEKARRDMIDSYGKQEGK